MRYFYFLLFTVLITNLSFAQKPHYSSKIHVTGSVVDSVTNLGLEYATLIFKPLDKKQITGGITDAGGKFDIEIPKGTYKVSVEFISFKTKTLSTHNLTQNTDLGIIALQPDREALDEVEIIAEKSTMEIRLDKKIYHVGKDMTVKGGNASDVLDNVPSVTVDVEGNVSLRGNNSVRILIDGKPSGLVGMNGTDALKQLPAEAIQKVEVITSPSARYEAEGTAGIINIILRKNKFQGFNAATTITLGYPANKGIATNLNFRAKKLNIFSNIAYNTKESPGNAHFKNFNTLTNNVNNEELRTYLRARNRLNLNLGITYNLTAKTSITGTILYRDFTGDTEVDNKGFKYDTNQTIILKNYRNEAEKNTGNLTEYSFNITKKFKTDGHKINFDISYQDSNDDENSLITDSEIYPDTHLNSLEKIRTIKNDKQLFIKSDYVLPIGKNKEFEAGFQSKITTSNKDYQVRINTGESYVLDDNVSNILNADENISAIYSQYGSKFGKISGLLGIRMEYTDQIIKVAGMDLDIHKKYTTFFPTINISYELNDDENITLGYNKRIRRPRSWHMSPFPSRSSTTHIFQGNPDLDPVYTNALDLGYFKKWKTLSLSTSVYYQRAENAFQYVREDTGTTNDDGIPIIITTPVNLNNEDRFGTEFSINYNPVKWCRLSNSFNFYQFKTAGSFQGINYGTTSQSWFNRFSSKIQIRKKIDFQTTFFYRGPYKNSVTSRKGMLMANLAVSKDVLQEKATLSLSVSDVFNTRKRKMETYFDNFTNYTEYQWRERQINLNFTYRFHQKKKRNSQNRGNYNGADDIEG